MKVYKARSNIIFGIEKQFFISFQPTLFMPFLQ